MEIPKLFFLFTKTGLGAGSTWSGSWTPTEDYTIEGILIRRADGQPFTASTITILLERKAVTRDSAPVSIFGATKQDMMPLGLEINAHETLDWSLFNGEGTTITVYLTIVALPKTPITGA
ncbi:MAG: hypothetical protein QXX81_08355 [Zestosphaera sp.]